jgi:hypothetical protein
VRRLCLALMLVGGLTAFLAAALFQGLSSPEVAGTFITGYSQTSSFPVRFSSDPARYLTVGLLGAVVGLVSGAVLHAVGMRMSADDGAVLTVLAGLLGSAIGLSPVLITMAATIDLTAGVTPLGMYAITGVLAYLLAIAAVHVSLRVIGDPTTKSTTRATAVLLPAGGILATAAGVGSAWTLGFSTATSTWIVVVIVVVLILSGTFAMARVAGVRRSASSIGMSAR